MPVEELQTVFNLLDEMEHGYIGILQVVTVALNELNNTRGIFTESLREEDEVDDD